MSQSPAPGKDNNDPLSIQWRLVIGALALLGAALIAGLYERRERLLDDERARMGKMAEIVELNLASRTQQTDNALLALRQLIPADHPERWNTPAVTRDLAKLPPFIGNLSSISLVDKYGRVRNATNATEIGVDLSQDPLFLGVQAAAAVTDSFHSDYRQVAAHASEGDVLVARPLFDQQARFAGLVTAKLTLSFLRHLLDSTRYTDDMRVSIAAANGTVVIVTPPMPGVEGRNVALPGSNFSIHMASGRRTSYYEGKTVAVGDMPRLGLIRSLPIANSAGPMITVLSITRDPVAVLTTWTRDVRTVAIAYLMLCASTLTAFSAFYRRQRAAVDALERARQDYEATLERQARFDVLTGIPNRMLLLDRLGRALDRARRNGRLMAVCYLDLDGFKPINDRLGHAAGDRVLVETAGRLTAQLRSSDTVARLGGDEFVLLLCELENIAECEQIITRVLAAIAVPIELNGAQGKVSASLGIALFPGDADEPDALLRCADQAMYAAKRAGKNCFAFFTDAAPQVGAGETAIHRNSRADTPQTLSARQSPASLAADSQAPS